MTRTSAEISTRKLPKQARSTELVGAILDAAIQVLETEGARRFTTARVAQKAGVSVGSLYQYFPNKASILFRLQSDEWQQTTGMLRQILEDESRPPLERVRSLVHTFVRSECEEAGMRTALNDAAPLYRDAPEAIAARAEGSAIFRRFTIEALPEAAETSQAMASELMEMTLSHVGKAYSEEPRSSEEIAAFSDGLADMLCAYLATLMNDPERS
jgi:AcrR family transcriptional regulator